MGLQTSLIEKKNMRMTVPVYEAIAITYIKPLHCALDQGGCNSRQHMI